MRMTIQEFGSLGEMLGAIAVLATLIYLLFKFARTPTRSRDQHGLRKPSISPTGQVCITISSEPRALPIKLPYVHLRSRQNVDGMDVDGFAHADLLQA
jgi:hypothetical protein